MPERLLFMKIGILIILQSLTMLSIHDRCGITFSLRFPVSAPMITQCGFVISVKLHLIGSRIGSMLQKISRAVEIGWHHFLIWDRHAHPKAVQNIHRDIFPRSMSSAEKALNPFGKKKVPMLWVFCYRLADRFQPFRFPICNI